MKKIYFLLLAGAMILCACQKEGPSVPPAPSRLPAEICQAFAEKYQGVFQLNEGQWRTNTATLDFLRFANGYYSRDIFQASGHTFPLGDTGNDVAIKGDELWMVINESGIVQVISKTDLSEMAAIPVPLPRYIAFDDNYAYVTSYAGKYDETEQKYPKGKVYRINLETKQLDGQPVEVGYQPEGIAYLGGKLYVANSGGYSSQIPGGSYDNTLSVIDAASFSFEKNIEVQVNLKNVFVCEDGNIYVTSLGNYDDVHSGLYAVSPASETSCKVVDYVTAVSLCEGTFYGIGAENEFADWSVPREYFAWSYNADADYKKLTSPAIGGTALSGLCVLSSGEGLLWMVTDQGDCFNPGSLDFYWKGEKAWSTTTGICPGHFAVL